MSAAAAEKAATTTQKTSQLPSVTVDLNEWYVTISQWFQSHWLELAIATAAAVAIYLTLSFIKRWARGYLAKQPGHVGYRDIALRAVAKTSRFFRIMVAIQLVTGFARTPAALDTVVHFLFTVSIVVQVAIWVREIILGLVERRTSGDGQHETLANAMTLIRVLVTFVVFAIAAIVILDNLGVNVTGLIAGLGVGGIAIGLAAQGIFSDLFAALSMIFDKPFRVGEQIRFDTTQAKVEKIGLKSTRLRALTGEQIVISNSNLLSKEITNVARLDHRRQTHVLGLVYQTPVEIARDLPNILREIVEAHDAKFVRCGMTGFGASSIDFELVIDHQEQAHDFDMVFGSRHAIAVHILEKFNELGIEFAYPTQTSYTAAPDGTMVYPYPTDDDVPLPPPPPATPARARKAEPATPRKRTQPID